MFTAAAALSLALTPLVRRLAVRLDNIDRPDHRRVNRNPIPRGGGMAVALAFLVVVVGFLVINDRFALVVVPRSIEPAELVALLAGGALATLLGVLDDTFQLRARWQLLGQLAVALVAVAAGITVTSIQNPFAPGGIPLAEPFAREPAVMNHELRPRGGPAFVHHQRPRLAEGKVEPGEPRSGRPEKYASKAGNESSARTHSSR